MGSEAFSRKAEEPSAEQQIRCWNGNSGCEQSFAIQDFKNREFNFSVRMCVSCCNRFADKWECRFENIGHVLTAIQCARAGKMGKEATKDEVWQLLTGIGMERGRRAAEYNPKIKMAETANLVRAV